jgi:hypothetical protein
MDTTDMYIHPTITDLYEKQAWFSTEPRDLAADIPQRSVQGVIDYWTPRVERILYEYSFLQAAHSVATRQAQQADDNDHYDIWLEAGERAYLLRRRQDARLEEFRETRGKFWWELAYVCHYESVMNKLSYQQLQKAKTWLRPLMPAAISPRARSQIYKSLRRKIYRTLLAGSQKAPRRLIRGLPLVEIGI